jgi:predicted ester cyclase
MTAEQNELLIRRLVEEAVNPGNLEVLDAIAGGEFAQARRWVGPFRASFPDFRMEIVDLVADSEKVATHFRWDPPRGMDGSSADRSALRRCR